MASAAILRSVARSLQLRQPLKQQRYLMERRFLSSSVPTERNPSSASGTHSRQTMEQKTRAIEKPKDVYERLIIKADKISEGLDEHSRLLKQLQAQIEENNMNGRVIDLTPWVVAVPTSLILFGLYNYVQG